jgi:hypothetical protein
VREANETSSWQGLSTELRQVLLYWEPRRIFYNLLLLHCTWRDFRADGALPLLWQPSMWFTLVGLALLANLAYTAAPVLDLGLRSTPLKRYWLYFRWLILLLGCWLAMVLTYQHTGLLTGGERMA